MQLFYSPTVNQGIIHLGKEEATHCFKALRKQVGDTVEVIDGKGHWYLTEVVIADTKTNELRIVSEKPALEARPYHLTIAIAPTKNISRFEWFLEKSTEIGIDRIVPIVTKNSERKVIKPERLNKILVSAMKQSGKSTLPELVELTPFKEAADKYFEHKGCNYVASCETELHLLSSAYKRRNSVTIFVGPEGDFTKEEVAYAESLGYNPISFGASRLRTETAGMVACQSIYLLNQ